MASSNNLDALFADGELPSPSAPGMVTSLWGRMLCMVPRTNSRPFLIARWPWPSARGRSGRLCRGRRSGTGEVEVYDRKKLAYANCAGKVIIDGRKEFANLN